MLTLPSALLRQFEEYLRDKAIPNSFQGAYKKWLRYYLDFCQKYHFPPMNKESLPHFIHKLQEKKQTKEQQEQAVMAITIYYEVLTAKVFPNKNHMPQPTSHPGYDSFKSEKHSSIRGVSNRPIQDEKVLLPLSHDYIPISGVTGASHIVRALGKSSPGPQNMFHPSPLQTKEGNGASRKNGILTVGGRNPDTTLFFKNSPDV